MQGIAGRFQPATVIDVGVAWGTPGLLRAFPGARFLLVEPLVEFLPALQAISSRYDAAYIIAAAGSRPGQVEIIVAPEPGNSSALSWPGSEDLGTRTVPVVTLDSTVEEHGLDGPYLLKLDVQGAELEILQGAASVLAETEIVALESSLFDLWQGAPTIAEVIAFMHDRGFVLYDLFGGDRRPLDGALAQIDLVFVAETSRLRSDHRYAAN